MAFRKNWNTHELWKEHCQNHKDLIEKLKLSSWTFENEQNFRNFATTGTTELKSNEVLDFSKLDDSVFWELFDFIDSYFEMDMSLFDSFEQARVNRK